MASDQLPPDYSSPASSSPAAPAGGPAHQGQGHPSPAQPAPAPRRGGINLLRIAAAVLILLGLVVVGWQLRRPQAPAPTPTTAAAPAPAAPTGPAAPSFDVVRVDQQGNTVIAGRAAPGAAITILDNGKPLGTVTADHQGAFVFLPASPLAVGSHDITLSAVLPNGPTLTSTQSAEVSVPANGGQVLTVLSGPNGSQVLSCRGPAAGALALGAVDYDTKGHAIFAGTAPAGATVSLHLGNTLLGTAKADESGHWHIAAPTPAAPGMLVVTGETASGSILPPVTQPFAPEALAQAFANGQVIIVPGDNLWLIARHIYGNGLMYTLIYTANSSQIHDPNLIFPGQTFVLPKPKG